MDSQKDQSATTTDMNGSFQEVSSTTPGDDIVTKRSLRVKTWKKIQQARISQFRIFNKIPDFVGNSRAAVLLAETEEFKKAVNIKVNVDRPQDPVRLEVISSGKNLYVTPLRESNALCTKVECPSDADERTKRRVLQRLRENRINISLEDKIKLDMVVIGSVVVSREGYRIGKGNGFVDLDLGILVHTGAITPETIIVTTVHDVQVVENLPKELFEKYDFPVDMIVTPNEVIRIEKKLPRPSGIFWEILSERRCKIVQILQKIKENEESAGKIITLKSEDTDIEINSKPRYRPQRYRYGYRSRARSQGNNDNRDSSRPGRRGPPGRRFMTRRRPTRSEGEQTSSDNKTDQNVNQIRNGNKKQVRKRKSQRDYCFKVSNIARGVRVKDLKAELKKRDCNPIYITWKGFGKCYLHFAKRKANENEIDINSITESLRDLKIVVQNGEEKKTVNLSVELLPDRDPNNQSNHNQTQRIESVDVTSV